MDKVAKGMTQASQQTGGISKKDKGIAQSLKDYAKEAVCKVKDLVNRSRQPAKR